MDNQNQVNAQQPKKKGMNGCLIAVIVVVCFFGFIIVLGILAAVAVPGYMQYINQSKIVEAKEELKAIANGAYAYYQTEHVNPDGETLFTKQYPVANTAVCLGPDQPPVGEKHDIETNLDGVWKDLNYAQFSPKKYTICYVSNGSKFVAKAFASINESCDSAFSIMGDGERLSAIIEEEPSNCNKPTL